MATADPQQLSKPRNARGSGSTATSPGRRAVWGATTRDLADRIGLTQLKAAIHTALHRPLTVYYLLLGATGLLLVIGLIMVLSASQVDSFRRFDDSYAMVKRQLLWVVIALPLAWLASRLPTTAIRRLAFPGYLVAMGMLIATAVLGVATRGNQNWLAIGPFTIQPSEFAKVGLILWAAQVYANKERRLHQIHHIMVPVVPGMLLATAMVIIGRDLGTGLVLFAIMLGMLWGVGAPMRLFVLSLSVIGAAAMALAAFNPVRLARLTTFADPFEYYHGTGWQAAHGLYALASGGWFGQGIGHGIQKWGELPDAHTDFIFAVLGEELGLIGTLLVVSLFFTIAYAGIRLARETEQPFVRYFAFGVIVWLLGQTMINLGMVLTLLPVIGIPLPLISYGGSSLLATLIALGLVIGMARREPAAAAALAARRRTRASSVSGRSTRSVEH